jgi:hypothetical protein
MDQFDTYARIGDGAVVELARIPQGASVFDYFHAEVANQLILCDTDPAVKEGWLYQDGVFSPPPPPPAQPPPPPVTDVSFWQFMMAAWKLEFITHAEALAAVRQRIMPPAFALAIAGLPAEAKLAAELKFAGITRMLRSDPLFALVVEANIATDEQIDGVFAVAAAIT